jgi:hypothetical protein
MAKRNASPPTRRRFADSTGLGTPVEKLIEKHGAMPDFKRLIERGCNRGDLIGRLSLVRQTPKFLPLPGKIFTISPKRVKGLQRSLWKIALELEGIFTARYESQLLSVLNDPLTLKTPALMRRYAFHLSGALRLSDSRRSLVSDQVKMELVNYVTGVVGHPCDTEVSALIAATTGSSDYSAEDHRKWRERASKNLFSTENLSFPPGTQKARNRSA